MRLVLISFFATIVTLLSGCSFTTKYNEVKIPVKCDVPEREKPKRGNSQVHYLKDILIYVEGLENDLAFCRGKEIKNTKNKER